MASTSEVGHNKNVANFNSLAQIIEEMGTLYNPSNSNITLVSLAPIQTTLTNAVSNFNETKPLYTNAVADREIATAKMSNKTSRILNSFKSLNVSKTDKDNAASLVKKIRGDNKPAKVNPNTADDKMISTSQMSYDSRIANFDGLISFVSSHPEYSPNETDIQIVNLKSYNQELKTLTRTVNEAGNTLITAKLERNKILYNNPENIIELSKEIKAYLKSLGEAGKPYYKAAVRLKFRDM